MEAAGDIKVIKLTALETAADEAWEEGKVPFFFDQTGNAAVFYNYKAKLVECFKGSV